MTSLTGNNALEGIKNQEKIIIKERIIKEIPNDIRTFPSLSLRV